MANLKTKVKLYIKTQDMSENEALWKILHEAQEQINDMDQKLAKCIENMNVDVIEQIFGKR